MKAKFVDSSVFIHAYLKPRRTMSPREAAIKEAAKEVVHAVEEGESVLTTVIHLSEIANIVEARLGLLKSLGLVARILSLRNIEVVGVNSEDYGRAIPISERYGVSLNDAIAYLKMKELGIEDIYSFDKHFRSFGDVRVLPELLIDGDERK